MKLRLVIDGGHVASLEDVYDLVQALPAVPDWFGRNLDAVDELAYFVKSPLHVVVRDAPLLKQRLGSKDYNALVQVLENLRDSTDELEPVQPVTLVFQEREF